MVPLEASCPHPRPGSFPAFRNGAPGRSQGARDSVGRPLERGGPEASTRGDTPTPARCELQQGQRGPQLSPSPQLRRKVCEKSGGRLGPRGSLAAPALPGARPSRRGRCGAWTPLCRAAVSEARRLLEGAVGSAAPATGARGAGHSPLSGGLTAEPRPGRAGPSRARVAAAAGLGGPRRLTCRREQRGSWPGPAVRGVPLRPGRRSAAAAARTPPAAPAPAPRGRCPPQPRPAHGRRIAPAGRRLPGEPARGAPGARPSGLADCSGPPQFPLAWPGRGWEGHGESLG